jgi:HK97 family phage major capsid protein
MPARYRESAQRAGIRVNAKSINLRMAPRALRSSRPDEVKAWEERALSTLTTTSPEDGSYLIANEMIRPLERALLDFGGVREVATVIRTTTGAALPFPTSDDTSNKGALLAENTQAVEKDTEFGQMVLNAYKFSSKKVLVSIELLQDSATDIASFLGAALGERIGRITADYFTTGTGSSQPNGIVTAATSSGVALAAATPTYAEMVSIQHSVDPAYRKNGAGWMFHDTVLAETKKIVDASTGRPIWLPNMIGGAPDTILGNPYTVNQSMAVAAGSGSGKSILYGQLSKYYVRDVMDIQLLRLDELYAEYGQVAFLAFSRSDGDLLDAGTHPIKYAANHS